MTAAGPAWPSRPPDHLIDLREWEALPEDDSARYELVEGVMVVSPRPALRHQDLVFELCRQLRDQLGGGLTALPEVELVVAWSDGDLGVRPDDRAASGLIPRSIGEDASRTQFSRAGIRPRREARVPHTADARVVDGGTKISLTGAKWGGDRPVAPLNKISSLELRT